ncbi:hypothetical protein [Corynebacterium pseudopelargi]|uniref:Uncharacterized protein n=1 Tax=Corynebacterium pseudopelargi TaxID=2080757 RepID=A0A3G6IUQ0_9CORY|nr:hypothetical protein [Corynebacterium pseudopelargi]AZA09326.1 hypothetical protein CPPEL_06040 [Corynebacterium pseudopelargi]
MYADTPSIDLLLNAGLQHPEGVADALQKAEELQLLQTPEKPMMDFTNLDKSTKALTDWYAHHGAKPGERSRFEQAVADHLKQLDGLLKEAAALNFEHYLKQLEVWLEDVTPRYVEAIQQLPAEGFDARDLTNFTPEQFEAYQAAKQAASELAGIIQTLQSIADLLPHNERCKPESRVFLIADYNSLEEGLLCVRAEALNNHAPDVYRAINPWLAALVRNGITFKLEAPKVANEKKEQLEDGYNALEDTERRDVARRVDARLGTV